MAVMAAVAALAVAAVTVVFGVAIVEGAMVLPVQQEAAEATARQGGMEAMEEAEVKVTGGEADILILAVQQPVPEQELPAPMEEMEVLIPVHWHLA